MKKSFKQGGMAAGIILMAILISVLLSNQKEPLRRRPAMGGIRPLKLMTVQNQDIPLKILMTGPLYAYHRVDLYA